MKQCGYDKKDTTCCCYCPYVVVDDITCSESCLVKDFGCDDEACEGIQVVVAARNIRKNHLKNEMEDD